MELRTPTDKETCLAFLERLSPDAQSYRVLVVDGEPRSKARPRFGGGGRVYTPRAQVEAERLLGWRFRAAFKGPMVGNVAVVCVFYRSNHGRVDTDNMLKHVMDAANKIIWHDDYQVTAMVGITELDASRPRTVIGVAQHESTLDRSPRAEQACATCGKTFTPTCRTKARRFCSTRCASLSRGQDLRASVTCPVCSTEFRRKHASQVYCGQECRLRGLHAKMPEKRARFCADCGQRLANRLAARCRACWRNSVAKPA